MSRRDFVISFIAFAFLVALQTLTNPVWFTNSTGYIDAWIYWGAADNPMLSFQNDFSRTYYLQRYVIIGPALIFYTLFGSFWGQLVTAVFWLTVSFYFLMKIASRYLTSWATLTVILIFFADPVMMAAFGSSYTMNASIALYSALFYFLCALRIPSKKETRDATPIFIGVTIALLLNAYMLHGIIALVISLSFFAITNLRKHIWSAFVTLSSCLLVSAVFQIIYFLISNDSSSFLLRQVRFGSNIATNLNPWGSRGFLDFWTSTFTDSLSYYWWMQIALFLFVTIFAIFMRAEFLGIMQLFRIGYLLLAAYFGQTFFYSNPIGYIWAACGVYMLRFITILVFLKIIFTLETRLSRQVVNLMYFFTSCIFFIALSHNLNSTKMDALAILSISLFVLIASILFWSKRFRFSATIFTIIISSLLGVSQTYGLNKAFRQFAVSFEGNFGQAHRHYERLSDMRQIVLEISRQSEPYARSWFTPDSPIPLVSSQLYMYSLVSGANEANCEQVAWAARYQSIIFSFGSNQNWGHLSNTFFEPCGQRITKFPIRLDLRARLTALGGSVWKLAPLT